MGKKSRFRVAAIASIPVIFGCVPEEPELLDSLTVQVPSGAGAINAPVTPVAANSNNDEAATDNSTPYGDFNATGLQSVIPPDAYSRRSGGDGGGNGDGQGGSGGSGNTFAPLIVAGSTFYSGMVSGSRHEVLEGGYPEINGSSSAWLTVGFDENQLPVGLSIPGFAGLSAFAIEVTPTGQPVEYSGTAAPPLEMDYSYEVTPRVWTADASGFHGEFDVAIYAEKNNFIIEGTMTHTIDGALQGDVMTYASTTHYDCELKRPNEQILFVAHQTFGYSGRLAREQED